MAKKTINIGSSENAGNGDPLRTAFSKINDNFAELYVLTGGGNATDLTELAQDYSAAMFTSSSHTGITFTYNDVDNKLSATVTPISWNSSNITNKPTKLSEFINDGNGTVDIHNDPLTRFALISEVETAISAQVTNNFNRIQVLDNTQIFLNDDNILVADNDVDTLSFEAGYGITLIPNKQNDKIMISVIQDFVQDIAASMVTEGSHPEMNVIHDDQNNRLNITLTNIDGGNASTNF